MKRVLLMAMAAVLLFAPAANAQKVNEEALRAKLTKSDTEIQDAKKSAKAATWLNRAKVYFESIQKPTESLFVSLDPAMLKIACGEPTKAGDTVWEYPMFKVYFKDGKVSAWEQTVEIKEGAIDEVLKALEKAHELDPKQDPKIKTQIANIINFYSQLASVSYDIPRYDIAQKAYEIIFKAESNPAYGTPDYQSLYFSGQLAAYLGATTPGMFARGEELLTKALANGYADEAGDIYYYLFHCYYGQKAEDPSKVIKAKDILLEGVAKFPKNDKLLDGLMQLYTSEDGVGDPADLVDLIEKALANDPQNVDLWFGRGRVYYKLNNYDECINSFKKVVELKPDLFDGNYYLALFYMAKGDELNKEASQQDFKSSSEANAAYENVLNTYKLAVPWFEKAHEIKPDHIDTVDCLKALCFRLRDSGDEYLDKYNKYNDLLKKLKGEAE